MFVMAKQSFGRWVEEQYIRRGWSQRAFTERMGLSAGTVSKWINKNTVPERDTCYAVADALELPVDEVLERAGHVVDEPRIGPDLTEEPTRDGLWFEPATEKHARDQAEDLKTAARLFAELLPVLERLGVPIPHSARRKRQAD